MEEKYEVLGWNEQNVLTLPPFRRYVLNSFVQLFSKLFIIIPSSMMIAAIPEVSKHEWCSGISMLYGTPAVLSIQFAAILLMIGLIIPCITNKQIKVLIIGFSSLLCFVMTVYFLAMAFYPFHYKYRCRRFESFQGRNLNLQNYPEFKRYAHILYMNTVICLGGWILSEVVSIIQMYLAYRKL